MSGSSREVRIAAIDRGTSPAATAPIPDPIPNGKTDTNNNGAFSTDYIGANYRYADGDYATRARIWQAHIDYVQGFLFFLQHDPQVPAALHTAMAPWGLCKDEFTDTAHWPHQLYVRESRRRSGNSWCRRRTSRPTSPRPT